jgi:hypothetical protein
MMTHSLQNPSSTLPSNPQKANTYQHISNSNILKTHFTSTIIHNQHHQNSPNIPKTKHGVMPKTANISYPTSITPSPTTDSSTGAIPCGAVAAGRATPWNTRGTAGFWGFCSMIPSGND